jgi:DNA-binding HxlR family transcriptional regulator
MAAFGTKSAKDKPSDFAGSPEGWPEKRGPDRAKIVESDKDLDQLLEVLERRWALRILWMLSMGPLRYGQMKSIFSVNPNTLRDRLRELIAAGLIARREATRSYYFRSYVITPFGREVSLSIRRLKSAMRNRVRQESSSKS